MNYGDTLCESIKIVSEALLEGLKFDKTIECTIIDDSKKSQGEYIVSDGSVKFTAYSENTSYIKNTVVYITIPNGDYNNDKIITGKKLKGKDNEPFIYTSPMSMLVDVTGNLIKTEEAVGLIANLPSTENGLNKIIYEEEFNEPYYNFSRLGLQAQFMSWLREFDCVSGNYGLKLTVDFIPENSLDQNNSQTITRELYLDVNDMIGNPYAFDSYYNQEKVFDIGSFGGVKKIKLEFFQDTNSFYTKNGKLIPYVDDFDNLIFSNLFVKECRVCLGYAIEGYNTEFVQLYSFNPNTYTSKVEDIDNQKNISLKWVHIDEEGNQIQMNSDSPYDYEIRWYRYKLGQPSADEYCGPGWINPNPLDETFVINNKNNFKAILNPDVSTKETEQIKVIILFGTPPANNEPDTRKIYHSNILSFSNTEPVVNSATLDAIQALSLVCKDHIGDVTYDTYGSYLIYDQGNQLIDKAQASVTRLIGCKFDLSSTNTDDMQLLKEKASIVWRFPITNTMIKPIDKFEREKIKIKNESGEEEEIETGFGLITINQGDAEITTYGMPVFKYTINNIYSTSRMNNIIECTVSLNSVNYHASKELRFGQSGTSGTDWTFSIDFEEGNAIIFNDTGLESGIDYNIIPYLQNNSGQIMDISNKTIEWDFIDPSDYSKVLSKQSTKIQIEIINGSNKIKLAPENNLNINDLLILKATLTDWEDYDLTAFLPIPLKKIGYNYLSGADKIIYLTDGYPQYNNSYYELNYLKSNNDDIRNFIYKRIQPESNEGNKIDYDTLEKYLPEVKLITKDNGNTVLGYKLKPVSMYVKNLPIVGVQAIYNDNIVWTQPILIIQNRYPSAMINKWNGKDLVLDKDNSTVISQMIGAGRKEDNDNSFTGVLIGDWTDNTYTNSILNTYTGIFGFNKGELNYSFTDDGKATIGKASGAQLIFDGNESTITSADYFKSTDGKGLLIDFDNGLISSKKNSKEIFQLSNENPYLSINNINGNTLMCVGDTNYYLQSAITNFTDLTDLTPASGMKINLQNGDITATTGSFYGGLTIYPKNGKNFIYKTYINNSGIVSSSGTNSLSSINLETIITDLKSNMSYVTAAANAASSAANAASSASTSANNAITALQNYFQIYDYLGRSSVVTIKGGGNASIQMGNAVTITANNYQGQDIYLDGGQTNISGSLQVNGYTNISNSLSVGGNLSVSGTYPGSDKKLKNNIDYQNISKYKKLFFDLQPVEYNMIKEDNLINNRRLGFIAQDVQKSLNLYGLNNNAIVKEWYNEENGNYLSLNYDSLFTLNTYMLQEAYKEIEQLKQEIKELKEQINK